MSPSKAAEPVSDDEIASSSSGESETSQNDQVETEVEPERSSKRRRLSDSSEDNYVAPAPLPTLSRIKKNIQTEENKIESRPDPMTAQDALEAGVKGTDSTFASLNLSPWLVASLSTMAIKRPTAIQKACIPEILKGRDCIGGSRTGSGKTVAFAAPILQKWAENPFGIFAVVLTPTR
jgi:ATP-dependent RNA helicase DDX49/DBP8